MNKKEKISDISKNNLKPEKLLADIKELRTSLSFIFSVCRSRGLTGQDLKFLQTMSETFKAIEKDLLLLRNDPSTAKRINIIVDDENDSIDMINQINYSFLQNWDCATRLWQIIAGSARVALLKDESQYSIQDIRLELRHAKRLISQSDEKISAYINLLREYESESNTARIANFAGRKRSESAKAFIEASTDAMSENELETFLLKADEAFEKDISYRILRRTGDDFVPVKLENPRPVDKFFGYQGAKTFFRKYIQSFSEGKENAPLLITSLPGLGKTHFTISFTCAMPNLVLVLCEPQDLEQKLEKIVRELALRKNRRFVLFFDDVDTRKVNWYYFRTNVGGTFNLPKNILIVIASNYDFPANIASRGRCFSFPLFDDINCMEMVHDYLVSLGMKSPPKELVSTIAADYVEEFGQRVFEELSPRTLVRYLDRFSQDTPKRLKLLNISKEKVVPVPEAALFYETNQKVIQRLNES